MKLLLLLHVIFSVFYINSQCSGNEPLVDLGNDTILCQGQTLALSAPTGYDLYSWSTNATTQSIDINSPGVYFVHATILAGNSELVVNGDFEAGNTGFSSNYTYVSTTGPTALWDPGYYAIGTSPNNYHSNFYNCADHTTSTGKMYIANGADIPNTTIWSQTITVTPNTNYNFSAWVSSVENTSAPAILQFFVNGIQIGNVFSPSSTGCTWSQFYNLWNSTSSTSAVISIKNQNTTSAGNDFALDDISFKPYCVNSDTITVIYDTLSVDAGPDLTFCDYEPLQLVGSTNYPMATLSWNTLETTSIITPTVSGQYTITAISPNGCQKSDAAQVQINQSPTAQFSASPQTGIVPLSVNFTNESQGGIIYYWDFANSNLDTTIDLSNVNTIYTNLGDYNVELIVVDINGCQDTSKVLIIAIDPVALETANVFTPNNDGVNDVYQFNMVNIKTISLTIVNRWGGVIKEITDPNIGWDGKNSAGNNASDGVYFYIFEAKSIQEESFKGHGFIHLVR
ncbi:MAG: gliding motility-associated C-terminal domain-containing protein [Flavobacteriia bacterium]|nr:gliding motility-associated C-terminal domain-containing protein [Flavobacteriia bacterium]